MFRVTLPPVVAFGLLAGLSTPSAQAADYLRGSYAGETTPRQVAPAQDWGGFYVGGFVGASSTNINASNMARPLSQAAVPNSSVTSLVQQTIDFKEQAKTGGNFGFFAGVNYLWDDVVLGMEVDYTRANSRIGTTSGPNGLLERTGSIELAATSSAVARAQLKDYGTIRGRIGYATGMFMPFLSLGMSLGYLDGRATVTGSWVRRDMTTPATPIILGSDTFSTSVGKRSVAVGLAFGGGIEAQIMPNTFLRAEYQRIHLGAGGHAPDVAIHTARVGGGVKF
ncbi:MAG: outer membrane beta-barrel protein [Proteobacteria bacterium]|nr:outer membrane beta-barrel protein [Pseudomonadota bacterium]